jgi:hypothetical protein
MMSTRNPIALATCMLLLISACGGGAVVESGSNEVAIPQVDLDEQPVADALDPADRAGASAEYVDCVHGISNGGWSVDFGPGGSASNPEEALDRFLDGGLFGLPFYGYVASGRDTGRMLYTHSVKDVPKVAVVVADSSEVEIDASDRWSVETFATCDPAEYDPATDDELPMEVWLDAGADRVPTSIITSFRGAEHCGWESVTYLIYEDQQFISDPRGVMGVTYMVPYDHDTELPADAIDTGYRLEDIELWMSADGQVAYLAGSDRVEAWPKPDTTEPVWCA